MTTTEETAEATPAEEEKLFKEILGMPDDPDRRWAAGDLFSLDLHKRNDGDDDNPTICITEDFTYYPAGKVVYALRKVADALEKKCAAHREVRSEVDKAQAEYEKLIAEGMEKSKAKKAALLMLLAAAKEYAAAEIALLITDVYAEKNDDGGEASPTP